MTTSHYHPIQKFCVLNRPSGEALLLGAIGPYILVLDLNLGEVLAQWPDESAQSSQGLEDEVSPNYNREPRSQNETSPSKRRKINVPSDGAVHSQKSSVSIELLSERSKDSRKKNPPANSDLPNVSHLISTTNGEHIVAATVEDKCVRVFQLDGQRRIKLLSERCMPKRLCTIALSTGATILAGDKFGDVYALPLHPCWDSENASPGKPQLNRAEPFQTSASELTVHTKGNREALKQQHIQKATARKKAEPTFEHQLILGHVSLLTDLVIAADPWNRKRQYILTADRDEHIRVSRGALQAHIINNYCLGHTGFVSKLCILPQTTQYLVSGGGEPCLKIWDWLQGTIVAERYLENDVKRLFHRTKPTGLPETFPKRAVSCIQPFYADGVGDHGQKLTDTTLIIVALEGTPSLATYRFDSQRHTLELVTQFLLPANVLDIGLVKDRGLMLVSLDNVHLPLSMKQSTTASALPIIETYRFHARFHNGEQIHEWIKHDPSSAAYEAVKPDSADNIAWKLKRTLQAEKARHEVGLEESTKISGPYSKLGELLYGLENLRKKSQGEEGPGQQAD